MRYFLLQTHPHNLPYADLRPFGSGWIIAVEDIDAARGADMLASVPMTEVASFEAASSITKLAFRNRFTIAEKTALYEAAKTEVEVQIYLDDIQAATYIDLSRPDTIAGVQQLEALGVLAEGRAAEILTTLPSATELR